MTDRKIFVQGNPRGAVHETRVRGSAQQLLTAVAQLREGNEPRYPDPDDLEILAHDYLAVTGDSQRHRISEPYPETIGATALPDGDVAVTLLDALSVIRRAYEDADERDALLDALWPVLLGNKTLLTSAVTAAWPTSADALREVVAEIASRRSR